MKYLHTIALVTILTFASMAASGVASAQSMKAMNASEQLGKMIAYEKACGISYNQQAISNWIDKNFPGDMEFANMLATDIYLEKSEIAERSSMEINITCTSVRRAAKDAGFIATSDSIDPASYHWDTSVSNPLSKMVPMNSLKILHEPSSFKAQQGSMAKGAMKAYEKVCGLSYNEDMFALWDRSMSSDLFKFFYKHYNDIIEKLSPDEIKQACVPITVAAKKSWFIE